MAQVISLKYLQDVNKKATVPTNNIGVSNLNLFLGENNNVLTTFRGIIIGDFMSPRENGIYIGRNLSLTEDGLTFKNVIIDGGEDQAYDLTRTNMIDIIDGVRFWGVTDPVLLWKDGPLPIAQEYNWGRPIIDGGVVENMVP